MGKLLLSRALLTMLVAPSASTSVRPTSFMQNVAAERGSKRDILDFPPCFPLRLSRAEILAAEWGGPF